MSSDGERLLKVKGIRDESAEKDKYELIKDLREQIKTQEDELEKAEKMNRNFERLVQFVEFLGRVDTLLSEKTKNVIKKLAVLTQEEEALYQNHKNDFE